MNKANHLHKESSRQGLPLTHVPEVGYIVAQRFKLLEKLDKDYEVQVWICEDLCRDAEEWTTSIGKTIDGEDVTVKKKIHKTTGSGKNASLHDHNEHMIIKLENRYVWNPTLFKEGYVLDFLKNIRGIPKVKVLDFDSYWNYIVFQDEGSNLQSVHEKCGSKMDLDYVLVIADQLIEIIEQIHSVNLIHGDIKPANMLISTQNKRNQIILQRMPHQILPSQLEDQQRLI